MSFRAVELPPGVPGTLFLASMPGRFGAWKAFEEEAQSCRLGIVVCLTPLDEVQELSPDYHRAIGQGGTPWTWVQLPIPNFGVPRDPAGFREGVQQIAQALRRGDAVLMHCAAGIGRTGSTAACVLKALGLPASEALLRVRDAGANPQNAAQSGFVDWF
jgi:hypothetical protein